MARTVGKLTALRVDRVKAPGMYADGAGLYLQVTATGAKSWIYRFWLDGKARDMGLGSLVAVPLSNARVSAAECRRLRQQGTDPIEVRRAAREQTALNLASAITFKSAAEGYIAANRSGWRNAKHAAQWESTLATYAYPVIGSLPVQGVTTPLVLKVIEPIWTTKPETAARLRGRIEAVLDWSTARGYRQGENPARWRGHIGKILPPKSKVRTVRHHAALPYSALPEFMEALRAQPGIAARALEFTILTAARTGEIIGAESDEIASAAKLWTVPAPRMKARKEHRVPLSPRALAVLKDLPDTATSAQSEYVFAGGLPGKPLSNMAMTAVLKRMGRDDLTVHGFRSTFRDWAAEQTNFSNEVVEMALAHTVSDKVEAAYRRGDLLEKRRLLMIEWGKYCSKPARQGRTVIPMRKARG